MLPATRTQAFTRTSEPPCSAMSGVLARIGELVSPSALDAMARRYVACAGRLAAIFGLLPSHEVALDVARAETCTCRDDAQTTASLAEPVRKAKAPVDADCDKSHDG